MRWIVVGICALFVASANASASTIEETTGICYQNDGTEEFGAECDFPDTIQDLQASPGTFNCNADPEEHDGATYGTIVPPRDGVPDEDTNDFCEAPFTDHLPIGTRIRVNLNLANQDSPASFDISLHLWDLATGEEITPESTTPELDATTAAVATASHVAADPFAVHSGKANRPFHPVSVSAVYVDGVSDTFSERGPADVRDLTFVVKNDPQHVTLDGDVFSLGTGDTVRLCEFSGTLAYSLLPTVGGNIKFEGTALAYVLGADLAALPTCAELFLDGQCEANDQGFVQECSFLVSNRFALALEVRAHDLQVGQAQQTKFAPPSLLDSKTERCHNLCAILGVEDPFPTDWEILVQEEEQGA